VSYSQSSTRRRARRNHRRGAYHGGRDRPTADEALRRYWDADAATYDLWPEHGAHSAGERAAWSAALSRLLPPPGASLLDVGAGSGFLSLAAARMGYRVTALDISSGMLARLRDAAARESLQVDIVCAPADKLPSRSFDAVMERLTLWTLPDPRSALRAWRAAAPQGKLLAFEGLKGRYRSLGSLRPRARTLLARVQRLTPEHHGPYPAELSGALPLAHEPSPERLIDQIEAAGWRVPQLTRLRDVEFARRLPLSPLQRLLGVTPEYAIVAHAAG